MSFVLDEIASQPECWSRAADVATDPAVGTALPAQGSRVAVTGCGTSYFMAQSFAALRESAGQGETDAWPSSEFPRNRAYDHVVAICRSGTTTEVVSLLESLPATRTTVLTTGRDLPAAHAADETVLLDFADERSVVQTRFATTSLALWRAHIGEDLQGVIADGRRAVVEELDPRLVARDQFTFVGTGWRVGVSHEAALKVREAAQMWTESYPAMEFRHGPVSVIDDRSAVWVFGTPPDGLRTEVSTTGGLVVQHDLDPQADLIGAQRLAVALAERKGLDPDRPRNLTRSIIL